MQLSVDTGNNGGHWQLSPDPPGSPQNGARNGAQTPPKADEPPKASATAVTMNLTTAVLGCGLLSMPWATAGSSILTGALLTAGVLLLNGCTIMILIVASHRTNIFDLGSLFKKIPKSWGLHARVCCDVTIWVNCFFCLIGNLIVAADSLEPFLKTVPFLHRQGAVASVPIAFCFLLPLCFLDQRQLAFSSGVAVAANIYALFLILALLGMNHGVPAENVCILNWGPGAVSMISVLMQAVTVQMCVLPMYEVLENRSPKRFCGCLVVSFSFVFVLFIAFSAGAYLLFGPNISSNVLKDLPENMAGNIARIGMGMTALAVYPIMLLSMMAPIKHSEERAQRRKKMFLYPSPKWDMSRQVSPEQSPASPARQSSPGHDLSSPFLTVKDDPLGQLGALDNIDGEHWFWAIIARFPAKPSVIASGIVMICSVVASIYCPNLGMVNIYAGAMSVAGLLALAPGVMGMYFMGRQNPIWFCAMVALLLFGLAATVLELKYTERNLEQVARNCIWRATTLY